MVNIEHRALRTFKQYASTIAARLIQQLPDWRCVGQYFRSKVFEFGNQLIGFDFSQTQTAQEGVVMG